MALVELQEIYRRGGRRRSGLSRSPQRSVDAIANFSQLFAREPTFLYVHRYEERIVELHSVIAELSRKLEDERDDVIREESEYEAGEDENDNSR